MAEKKEEVKKEGPDVMVVQCGESIAKKPKETKTETDKKSKPKKTEVKAK